MKEIEKTVKLFVAFDGAEFDNAAKCREHEKTHGDAALVGLTAEQVTAAVAGDLQEIGDAIERAARKIAAARIAKGGRKRKAKETVTQEIKVDINMPRSILANEPAP